MALNWKYITEKLKTKNKRYRNTKKQNTKRRKPIFTKRIGRKCRLLQTGTEQNNDHTRTMHKIQFYTFFKFRYQEILPSKYYEQNKISKAESEIITHKISENEVGWNTKCKNYWSKILWEIAALKISGKYLQCSSV